MRKRPFGGLSVLAAASLLSAAASGADDRATIDRTNIIGNRELPKVLYIVPWKKPAAGDLSGPPAESVLDEALAPLDRDVFRRQVHYSTLTNPDAAVQPAGGADVVRPAPDRK
ncbi:MAG TPA: hypothetical protein VH183_15490 [Burkholderiaceae bacterium]|jgi:hypothetical protein|nr:hypothetical protein [Burkholderiaceae bacterium]